MFRTVLCPSSGIFALYTQQWYMSYRFADSLRAGSGQNCSSVLILLASCNCNLYDIYHCCVYSAKLLMMDRELSETRRVLFQNKFEKLVHLVGFSIRIYHDARSSERHDLVFFLIVEWNDNFGTTASNGLLNQLQTTDEYEALV